MAVALAAVAAASIAASSLADEIVVTRDSLKLPAGCSAREVGALLSRFTRAVTNGDQAELAQLFVTEDPPGRAVEPAGGVFRWYSVTEGRSGAAQPWRHRAHYDQADLLAYFAERHGQNERMAVIDAEVRPSRLPEEVGIVFRVRREADDLPSWLSPYAGGKAGIACASPTPAIFLWSMGQSDRAWGATCPRPPGSKLGAPIVACSSGPNAPALASRFRVIPTRVNLPTRCKPERVRTTVRRALSAFNQGLGDDLAKLFVAHGQLHPYTSSITSPGFMRRPAIARFVGNRYHRGDGWTGARLFTPQGSAGLPSGAVYGVDLRVSYQGATVAAHVGAKLVVDCGSGLLRAWVGASHKNTTAVDPRREPGTYSQR